MAHDVFISHSSKDKTIADAICGRLERQGIRCWMAPRDIRAGSEWTGAIVEAIRGSRIMVLVFSNHANESAQVQREVQQAFQKELLVIPFRIASVVATDQLEYYLSGVHWLDAITPPVEHHLDELLGLVRSVLQSEPARESKASTPPPVKGGKFSRPGALKWAAAAMIAIGLVSAGYWLFPWHKAPPPAQQQQRQQPVPNPLASSGERPGHPPAAMGTGTANDAPSLIRAAQAGDITAMRRLGRMYADGAGVEKDYLAAMKWSSAAAGNGDADAMCDVGVLYADGHGVARDYAKAIEWFERAAGLGSGRGMRDLGQAYRDGQGVERNVQTALEWLKKAADKGDTVALYLIGRIYQEGKGVDQDFSAAVSWYEKGVAAGDTRSMNQLALMYKSGTGVRRDAAHAFQLYSQAAQAGDAYGMVNLGDMFRDGLGTQTDFQQALTWFKRAVDAGDAGANNEIGALYEHGQGVAPDVAQAVAFYRKAAAADEPAAMCNLARCLATGNGVARDVRAAMRMFRQAANLGNEAARRALISETDMTFSKDQEDLYARINLAIFYLHEGPDEDPAQSFGMLSGLKRLDNQNFSATFAELLTVAQASDPDAMTALGFYYTGTDLQSAYIWFSKAADAGQAVAMDYLGLMYTRGDVVAQSDATALQWYQRAADTGSAAAMSQLGLVYQDGNITPMDDQQAVKWITDAAELGFVPGMRELGEIYSQGTGVPVDFGQARRWFEKSAAAGDAESKSWLADHPGN